MYLVREALAEHGLAADLEVVEDGRDAIARIRGEGRYAQAPVPDVVLLDLNLPRCDGRDVLRAIRENPATAKVPVAVLTSSDSPRDRADVAELAADRYVLKPFSLDEFMIVGAIVRELWSLGRR